MRSKYTDQKKKRKFHKKSSERVAKQNGIEWHFMHMEVVLLPHILALFKGQFRFPSVREMTMCVGGVLKWNAQNQ